MEIMVWCGVLVYVRIVAGRAFAGSPTGTSTVVLTSAGGGATACACGWPGGAGRPPLGGALGWSGGGCGRSATRSTSPRVRASDGGFGPPAGPPAGTAGAPCGCNHKQSLIGNIP